MSRKPSPVSSECPYHITARTNNREWFALDLSEVWKIFGNQLFFIHHAFGIRIHSFVLMSNHFHLLMSDPNLQKSRALRWLMTETSREIGKRTHRMNHLYGQRNYQCLIPNYTYYMNAYKYVYQNPVQAGACLRVEEYPYSTLHGLLGFSKLNFPVNDDLLFDDLDTNLWWLNKTVRPEHWDGVSQALRKSEFKLAKDHNRNSPSLLENQLI